MRTPCIYKLQLLVAMALVLLTSRFPTYLLSVPVALIMCRELGVSALREWMASRGKRNVIEVGIWGKLKTACQMVATILLLSVTPTSSPSYDLCGRLGLSKLSVFGAGVAMLHVSTILTLFSGWQYLRAAWPTLMGHDESQ
jgi:CDP-diacylglycerol--glycerol-3-phosphate 3-phosphatidyltransferase